MPVIVKVITMLKYLEICDSKGILHSYLQRLTNYVRFILTHAMYKESIGIEMNRC